MFSQFFITFTKAESYVIALLVCLFVCLLDTLRKIYELIFMKLQWVYGTVGWFERVLQIITWIQKADIKI